MTTVDDPAATYADDAAEEQALFGASEVAAPEVKPVAPPKKRRGRPGPPPDPTSGRQQKLARAAMRSTATPAPPKKRTPNTPHTPSMGEVYQRGAQAVLGWVARPLAMAGIAMQVASSMPVTEQDPRRAAELRRKRANLAFQGQALALDTLTIGMHADALAAGLASTADHLPWMARVLEQAARISPFAALLEASTTVTLQILTNHGLMPPMATLGTLAPDDLAAAAGVPVEESKPDGE